MFETEEYMTFRDLENEGWIKFEGCDDLEAKFLKKNCVKCF